MTGVSHLGRPPKGQRHVDATLYGAILRTATFVAAALVILSNAQAAVTLLPVPDGHFSVPVLVNGAGPYAFILDTAADSSGVYQWFAEES